MWNYSSEWILFTCWSQHLACLWCDGRLFCFPFLKNKIKGLQTATSWSTSSLASVTSSYHWRVISTNGQKNATVSSALSFLCTFFPFSCFFKFCLSNFHFTDCVVTQGPAAVSLISPNSKTFVDTYSVPFSWVCHLFLLNIVYFILLLTFYLKYCSDEKHQGSPSTWGTQCFNMISNYTLTIDGNPVATTTANSITQSVSAGDHSWTIMVSSKSIESSFLT